MRALMLILVLALSGAAFATDLEEVQTCLANWKDHPFKTEKPEFRVISAKVRVMGIGDELADLKETSKPELVLIKPNVTVMSKSTLRLMNPNGWYCVKGKVAVMGKAETQLHCKAHMTTSDTGATVLGSADEESGGVTVLGSSKVTRAGCSVQ